MSNKTRGENHNQLNLKTSTETKTNQLNSILNIDHGGKNHVVDAIFENQIAREWLTTKEAAHFLGVSENALRIMVCRGQVEVYKFGRRLRFRFCDCQALIQKKGA